MSTPANQSCCLCELTGPPSIYLRWQTHCLLCTVFLFLTSPEVRSSAVTFHLSVVKQISVYGRAAVRAVDMIWTLGRLRRINVAMHCADRCAVILLQFWSSAPLSSLHLSWVEHKQTVFTDSGRALLLSPRRNTTCTIECIAKSRASPRACLRRRPFPTRLWYYQLLWTCGMFQTGDFPPSCFSSPNSSDTCCCIELRRSRYFREVN